ncbi:hypothetical protein PS662_06117 [Pseudomonas fluorescens]|uniref:Uncharacterized protein n=1 Tax=Pseudomonas fluorescens TaxID=294 RepID=A0A5E6Y631_PSEFL|nr:hypothetical protein PS662_06117 [Pseudomonas fluorescens]
MNGGKVVSCEPMWQSTPTTSRFGNCAARMYTSSASAMAMPNLFSLRPVEMYGCVPASTSGFTRNEIGARTPSSAATTCRRSSSSVDSTLKQCTPTSSARRMSSRVLPTPENTILSALPPAARTRSSSPRETMSKPAPRRARTFSTPRLELALTAKQTMLGMPASASAYARYWASMWARE